MIHHLPDLPTSFDSQRLHIRRYQPEDAGMYFGMIRANWDHLYEFLPPNVEAMQTGQDAAGVFAWAAGEWEAGNIFLFGMWEITTGAYAGEIYLANADWHVPSIELGYFLIQAATGRGLATEAARRVSTFAFEHLQVERVDLQCRGDNIASQKVAMRAGFRLEGRQRLRHRKKDGTLVDRMWYGLLRSEWRRTDGTS